MIIAELLYLSKPTFLCWKSWNEEAGGGGRIEPEHHS
jgi:hypothetical protein